MSSIEVDNVFNNDDEAYESSGYDSSTASLTSSVYEYVFENYVHDIFVDNIHMELSLWDTAGQEEFDRLRSLSYDDTQAIMLCFSVDSRDSLENVASKWVAEITEHCQGVKVVLCALKCWTWR